MTQWGALGAQSTASEGVGNLEDSLPPVGSVLFSKGKVAKSRTIGFTWASLMTQMVKNPPAMRETWVRSLGWEDPLEKGMATHSSILAWRIPWTEEPGGLQLVGSQRVRHS